MFLNTMIVINAIALIVYLRLYYKDTKRKFSHDALERYFANSPTLTADEGLICTLTALAGFEERGEVIIKSADLKGATQAVREELKERGI